MEAQRRNDLLRIAAAAQFLADDVDPNCLFCFGNSRDIQRTIEWHKTRKMTTVDARHLAAAMASVFTPRVVGGDPTILKVLLQYVGRPPIDRYLPENIRTALCRVIIATNNLGLEREPMATDMDAGLASNLRDAGIELQNAAAFVPSELQREIIDALHGKALTADTLQTTLSISRHTLFGGKTGKGGLNELRAVGMVQNDRKVGGYFRPDCPPVDTKAH